MHVADPTIVLDLKQLRNITLDDPELMREILSALIEDTTRQIAPLDLAIRARDAQLCASLAHYSKGACASAGANSIASLLKTIEHRALRGEFHACAASLMALSTEITLLSNEAAAV